MSETDLNHILRTFSGMPAAEFLLHRDSMLLLDTLVEAMDDVTVCRWTVRKGGPFVGAVHGIPAYTAVEFMAQCIGVHAGARERAQGFQPPLGYFLGTRKFTSTVRYFSIGEDYVVNCRELFRDGNGMGSYDCEICKGEETIAAARLAVLEKEQGQKING
jgi:predicted hotdog family 3-hydroxylacyl-ACP dehydratase